MSSTRLLVLGVVRIFQPAHGYLVRRELMSWRVDQWAALHPGSIYNMLRTLERDGMLEEAEKADGKPHRTSYRLTADGETEFLALLREALWRVDPYDPRTLLAGASFMWALTREEVVAALESRVAQLEAAHRGTGFAVDTVRADPTKPSHVSELLLLADARMQGELAWAREVLERLRAGEHEFALDDSSNLNKV
jgi:DNA-binding PadR family transcriptional regulator